jgi:hypothetical protein
LIFVMTLWALFAVAFSFRFCDMHLWSIVRLKFKLEAIWIWANLLNWVIVFLESKRVIFTLHLFKAYYGFHFHQYSNVNHWHRLT